MQKKLTDIHCHILPGIDDGPRTMEEAFQMVKSAVDQGISTIIATPHFIPGEIEVGQEEIINLVNKLQELIDDSELGCKIYPGMEVYLTPEIIDLLDEKRIIPLCLKSNYLLIELPNYNFNSNMFDLLYEINLRGYIPIIAHPERNRYILNNNEILNELLQQKVLFQVNVESILGLKGNTVRKLALRLLEQKLIDFVASDGHSIDRRPINLNEGFKYIEKKADRSYLELIFFNNPESILNNEFIKKENKGYCSKKGLFARFKDIFA